MKAVNSFKNLEEQKNILMDILAQKDHDMEDLEETIVSNVERFIRPSLNYLKKTVEEKDVNMVSELIDQIVYPLTKKRPTSIGTLTPRELQVATLIKKNCTSKEIGDKLCISKKAVDYHRSNIRKKLNLKHTDNLQIYIESHF
jgi:DNA-binding CsgD family transcriptional regulator